MLREFIWWALGVGLGQRVRHRTSEGKDLSSFPYRLGYSRNPHPPELVSFSHWRDFILVSQADFSVIGSIIRRVRGGGAVFCGGHRRRGEGDMKGCPWPLPLADC